MGPKLAGIPILGILRIPLGRSETKCNLDASHVARHKVYYKGEGGGFPQVRAVVSLVSPSCPWLILAPKVFSYALTNLLFGLCRFV